MSKTTKILDGQSVLDIALREFVDIDATFEIIRQNALDLAYISPGAEIVLPDYSVVKKKTQKYMDDNKLIFSSGVNIISESKWVLATGYWRDSASWSDAEYWKDT